MSFQVKLQQLGPLYTESADGLQLRANRPAHPLLPEQPLLCSLSELFSKLPLHLGRLPHPAQDATTLPSKTQLHGSLSAEAS